MKVISPSLVLLTILAATGSVSASRAHDTPLTEPATVFATFDCGCVPVMPAESCCSGCASTDSLFDRDQLTGDWFGARSGLAEKGLTFDLYGTQFYQGVAAGGVEQEGEYGGKFDYLVHLNGSQIGMTGLFVDLHGESRLGDTVNQGDGLLAPSNIAMNFPADTGDLTALTGVKITQALSENFAVFAGKINTLDEYPLRFDSRLGLDRPGVGGFMNTSLVFNPIGARTVPYSAAAVGAAILRDGAPLFSLTVMDPQERATIGLEDLYSRGVVIVPDLILRGEIFDRPSTLNLGGTYSNAQYTSVDPASYLILPQVGIVAGQETGSWSLYANGYHALWVDPADKTRTWGVFGQFGISDGNPNPVRYVANGGIAGRSMLPSRTLDTFGAAFYYLGLSDSFKALAAPVLPQQDEFGGELFYNYALTPWCRLTADLQVAQPSTRRLDTVIIPGMRMQVVF